MLLNGIGLVTKRVQKTLNDDDDDLQSDGLISVERIMHPPFVNLL